MFDFDVVTGPAQPPHVPPAEMPTAATEAHAAAPFGALRPAESRPAGEAPRSS